jgi:hypothetical protein
VRTLALDTPIVTLSADVLRKATDEDIASIDDVPSTAAYRRHVAFVLPRA